METGHKEAVAGYVIPAGQHDMTRVERLVNLLRLQGIELGRAAAEVRLSYNDFKSAAPASAPTDAPARQGARQDRPEGDRTLDSAFE